MYTIKLLLNTSLYEDKIIDKRFHALNHIHNVIVKHAKKLLINLKHNNEYQTLLKEYYKNPTKELSSQLKDIRHNLGLDEYSLQSYIKVCAKLYKKCLSSQQIQKEVTRVYSGIEKVLFNNGKDLHYSKYEDLLTIGGKSNLNGVRFNKETNSISWIGLNIKCKNIKNNDYINEALKDEISYCEIERKMFNNGYHYYVIIYLRGNAPLKIKHLGNNTMGLDPGTSTIAGVSKDKVILKELASNSYKYNKKINKLLIHLDNSRRINNPNKYNLDGTINKFNHDKWNYSHTYLKNKNILRSLYRKKSEYIKQSHNILCNELLDNASTFIIEDMAYNKLQRRNKNTEITNKHIKVKAKDGTIKEISKIKKKKRFGRSLNNRSPSLLLRILEDKCKLYGGTVLKVNMNTFKASQYNHINNTYEKIPLSQREKLIGNNLVQRDLYSAFLLSNSNKELTNPDINKCNDEFNNFLNLQNNLIKQMKNQHISMKSCFGF